MPAWSRGFIHTVLQAMRIVIEFNLSSLGKLIFQLEIMVKRNWKNQFVRRKMSKGRF